MKLRINSWVVGVTFCALSMLSTVTGTGAMATGIIVTVPGVLRTRKQSKCLSMYLLKIHHGYDELRKKPANKRVSGDLRRIAS